MGISGLIDEYNKIKNSVNDKTKVYNKLLDQLTISIGEDIVQEDFNVSKIKTASVEDPILFNPT